MKTNRLRIKIRTRPDGRFSLRYYWGRFGSTLYEGSLTKDELKEVIAKLIDETDWA